MTQNIKGKKKVSQILLYFFQKQISLEETVYSNTCAGYTK